jgi:hypothetical protein
MEKNIFDQRNRKEKLEIASSAEIADSIPEPLDKIVQHLEEEGRMILPGIQALFGFQLIAVFNQRFTDLTLNCLYLHFAALLCTTLSVVLVLTPAAFHRQAEPDKISSWFCRIGSLFLTLSLFPLAIGNSLDLYVIGRLVMKSEIIPLFIGIIALALFLIFWFVYPQFSRRRRYGSPLAQR